MFNDLIKQVQQMGIPGDILKGYLSSGNKGIQVMRLKNWIKSQEKAPSFFQKKKRGIEVAPGPLPLKEDTFLCAGDISAVLVTKVYEGWMTKEGDRRSITISSTGTGYYMLKVSRKDHSKLCSCCFSGLYDGIRFRKSEIQEKLEGYKQSGFDIQIQFK